MLFPLRCVNPATPEAAIPVAGPPGPPPLFPVPRFVLLPPGPASTFWIVFPLASRSMATSDRIPYASPPGPPPPPFPPPPPLKPAIQVPYTHAANETAIVSMPATVPPRPPSPPVVVRGLPPPLPPRPEARFVIELSPRSADPGFPTTMPAAPPPPPPTPPH